MFLAISVSLDEALVRIQRDLFALGAELADPHEKISDRVAKAMLADGDVTRLEAFGFDQVREAFLHVVPHPLHAQGA